MENDRDGLTGLFNRRATPQAAEALLAQSRTRGGTFTLIYLDIDRTKPFNDRYGHMLGDRLIQGLAQAFQSVLPVTGVLGRIGGDEFLAAAVLADEAGGIDQAEQIRAVAKRVSVSSQGWRTPPVTVTLGVAFSPRHGDTIEALWRAADDAQQQGKSAGGDRVSVAHG